jgi:hypothetical protein
MSGKNAATLWQKTWEPDFSDDESTVAPLSSKKVKVTAVGLTP